MEARSVGAANTLTIRRKTPQRRSSCREARGLNKKEIMNGNVSLLKIVYEDFILYKTFFDVRGK